MAFTASVSNELVFNLAQMPSGIRYEDRYGEYLNIFKRIAQTPIDVQVVVAGAPGCWIPLLRYLSCRIRTPQIYFEHCAVVLDALTKVEALDRTTLEVLCGFRPETVDALWKIDMQWKCAEGRVRLNREQKSFMVTNNGSFHRPEVLRYLDVTLKNYVPKKRKVVLVPCAADKPYPARLHQAVLDMMPKDYYLAVATGVLGIVPQDLWGQMPYYDSGLPNEWRLMRVAQNYFARWKHDKIVVYADYYNEALHQAFKNLGMLQKVSFCNAVKFYHDYLPLLDEQYLNRLRANLH